MEITRTGRADPTTRRKGNRTAAAVRSMGWVYTTQQITHCARKLARKKQSLRILSCSSWSSTKAHQLDPQHYDILQSIGLTLHVEEETPQNKNIAREI